MTQQLGAHAGPVVASTDYMKNYADQIRAFIPKGRAYRVLGTDGFGRSDFRSKLREHFEVNRHYIVVAALKSLADEGTVPLAKVAEAIATLRHRHRQDQPAVRLNEKKETDMALVEVQVPDIGDFKDVEIIELLVKPGDTVAVDQSLLTVESDKASMEIPSTHAGVVKEMKVGLGDKVSQGSVVLVLEAAAGAAAPAAGSCTAAEPRRGAAPAAPAAARAAGGGRGRRRAGPGRGARYRRLRPRWP